MRTHGLSSALKMWASALLLFFAAGCAAVPVVTLLPAAVPAIIAGAGGGVSYTLTNTAYKTTVHALGDVDEAVMAALEKMSIKVLKKNTKKHEIYIKARTRKLKIYITLEEMTPALTRITVNVKRYLVFKDKTTAFEIIRQADMYLERVRTAEQAQPGLSAAGVSLESERPVKSDDTP